jgi:hypothetical protein
MLAAAVQGFLTPTQFTEQVALEAAATDRQRQIQLPVMEVQTQVEAEVAGQGQMPAVILAAPVDQALSSFVTLTHTTQRHLPQALQQLLFLAATAYTNGLAPVRSRSKVRHGSLCTTR